MEIRGPTHPLRNSEMYLFFSTALKVKYVKWLAYGWVVRFCQLSVQLTSWSWLPIMEAPGCLRHPASTKAVVKLVLHHCCVTSCMTLQLILLHFQESGVMESFFEPAAMELGGGNGGGAPNGNHYAILPPFYSEQTFVCKLFNKTFLQTPFPLF